MYELFYTDEFKKDAKKLDASVRKRLKKAISKILQNPTRFKHLEHSDRFRVRFDVYRILYKVENNKVILFRVGKRDTVYD